MQVTREEYRDALYMAHELGKLEGLELGKEVGYELAKQAFRETIKKYNPNAPIKLLQTAQIWKTGPNTHLNNTNKGL